MDTIEVAKRVVEVASDKLAKDIMLLDTRRACSFADYFVVCSTETERHMEALRDAIDKALRKDDIRITRCEGTPESGWMLLDLGNVIVHIFAPLEREYYGFDELWSKAQLLIKMQ